MHILTIVPLTPVFYYQRLCQQISGFDISNFDIKIFVIMLRIRTPVWKDKVPNFNNIETQYKIRNSLQAKTKNNSFNNIEKKNAYFFYLNLSGNEI